MKNITLLYVEDETAIREKIAQRLRRDFSEVICAQDGEEGLSLYRRHQPDMIITDAMMPIKNGIEMIEEIRETDPRIKIILMTALSDISTLSTAINAGIDGYVPKPLNTEQFNTVLEKLSTDICNQKQLSLKNALLNQYKNAVDSSNIVSKTDPKGIITYVNERFCNISGYRPEELIGKSHNIIRHPDMSADTFRGLWETIQQGDIWEGIVKNRTKDGRTYVVDATIMPITDTEGNILEYVGIRHDVTELEQYRELLERQLDDKVHTLEEKMNMLSEYEKAIDASTSFSRTDTEGKIVYVNDAFCKRSGFERSELIGKNHNIIRHPEMEKEFFKELWDDIKAKKIWKGIIKNQHKDGSSFHTDTTIVPIMNTGGEIAEYMSIRHDVTELVELTKEIEQTQKDIIYALGNIAEGRSHETGHHVKRVAEYSKVLAKKLGFPQEEIDLIKLASPMHDIGKVAIPDHILNKPGPLDPEEYDHMKEHTLIGFDMLKNSDRPILKTAAIIAMEHHERWDGKGYPHGKAGEDIHIYGRITAVADVFDALGSDRVYKKAWELDRILELFREERGRQFDPLLVDLFFENLDDFLAIRSRYH